MIVMVMILSFHLEDDLSSIGEDLNQPILLNSDSDDTEASLTSSESESEDDNEVTFVIK